MVSEAQTNQCGKFPLRALVFTRDRYLLRCTTHYRADIFKLKVMTSSLERHLSLWAVENPTFIVSCRWTKHLLSRAASLRCISPTLMQQQLLRLQEQCLSDWVRVPLTFSHFTETVLKRPSQSPDFMAEPSQGPADLMDITRINQTFMPTRSSTVGDKAWQCVERRHDSELRSVCHYVLLCFVVQCSVLLHWSMCPCVCGCQSNASEG